MVNGPDHADHADSPDGGTGKTCLDGGMHCPSASSFQINLSCNSAEVEVCCTAY